MKNAPNFLFCFIVSVLRPACRQAGFNMLLHPYVNRAVQFVTVFSVFFNYFSSKRLQKGLLNVLTIKSGTSDTELIQMILSGNASRNKALETIYRENREKVFAYIVSNSGTQDQAKDILQESVIALYENVRDGRFKGESAIGTYLYSIARFKWLNEIKKMSTRTSHHMEMRSKEDFDPGPLATLLDAERQGEIHEILASLGERCKELLIQSIYHNASMKEIAAEGGYSSEQIVRNTKYKCLKKLKELIAEKPQLATILRNHG